MQNLIEELKSLLQKDKRITDGNGKLLKNKITELTLKHDKELINLLLSDTKAKEHFFIEEEFNNKTILIFDKDKFIKFINNKAFLPNSYTSFKKRIGLMEGNEYLNQKKDIVLAWAYKDCVLEGGQDKDDQKRNEIFYNEILAPDEIDRLVDPKVLTNFKKYDENGENTPEDIKDTDNLIIKGNNLLALYCLKEKYRGKIKLIYIDPPYNTGNDSFHYNDRFNHSTWLTFMKNRLEVARDLLRDDGVIFVQCDDNEQAYLKVLMDGVFGRKNFVATLPRKTRSGKSDVPYKLSQDFDFIEVYSKNGNTNNALFKRQIERKYYKSEDFPNDEWRLNPLTKQTTIKERPNSNFTIINPKNGDEFPVNPNSCWRITKDTFPKYYEKGKIVFPGDYNFLNISKPSLRIFKSEEIAKKGKDFDKAFVSSDFLNNLMDNLQNNTMNQKGTNEIIELFEVKKFAFPKNELLMQSIIEFTTDKGDIVLDYHLGSGTTCAVAHKMGRQYIGIEQMNYIEKITCERLKKVIAGEQGGISKSVNWQGGGSFVYAELKEWNQEYIRKIAKADNSETLLNIYQNIKNEAFFRYEIDLSKFDNNQFLELSLNQQKEVLRECLDKNHLYVNLTEIEDTTYKISDQDKKLNKAFYKKI